MNYNLNLEEFETVSQQLLLEEELDDLSLLLLDHDIDDFVVCPSSQGAATFTLKDDKLFIKTREGIFKSLL